MSKREKPRNERASFVNFLIAYAVAVGYALGQGLDASDASDALLLAVLPAFVIAYRQATR